MIIMGCLISPCKQNNILLLEALTVFALCSRSLVFFQYNYEGDITMSPSTMVRISLSYGKQSGCPFPLCKLVKTLPFHAEFNRGFVQRVVLI